MTVESTIKERNAEYREYFDGCLADGKKPLIYHLWCRVPSGDLAGVMSDVTVNRLPPRQRQVFELMTDGHGIKAIAQILDLSTRTIEHTKEVIMRKLEARNLAGLIAIRRKHDNIKKAEQAEMEGL